MTIRVRRNCLFALAGFLAIGLSRPAVAESPPLWDGLQPGPHLVGFKTGWQFDYSRRYEMTFEDKTTYSSEKAPRPILVNVWYPAERGGGGKKLPHRGYLEIRSDDPRLARFSAGLADYERNVIVKEVMGKPAKELTARERTLLDEFLDMPTACMRDALPARGSFPLVIYHSGAGSSFEDNAVLCEFLASHGFVVVGSAFQRHGGKTFNVDGRDGSARDLEFLIAHARQIPGVDWGHIGLVGHSLGAQAALLFASQPESALDAVVSLDTTEDYHSLKNPIWEDVTTPVVTHRDNVRCPVLMAAGCNATFELADSLLRSQRHYLTFRELGHNDYISQGNIHNDRLNRLHRGDPGQSAEGEAAEKAALETARSRYRTLCVYILRFLEAELKADAAAREFLATQYRDTKLGGIEPHVEFVPEGRTGPDPYTDDATVPPTPRQLLAYYRQYGAQKSIAVFKQFRKVAPDSPIYREEAKMHRVSDLLDEGKIPDAVAFSDYFRETGVDCKKLFVHFGKAYQRIGSTHWATLYFKRALLLEPSNAEAAAGLKELDGKK